ncbi:hypothetical protein [Actinomyces trachealis]|uniref:hypothetical protein n=1 Tax=Actinomyces trachealis TaxID=2763540 RepID=UPI001892B8AF|nr:hypothetical protein [Actinomyces trachealis]
MALRFNPPPNWPTPPEGFVPPAGWQPDPAWGPAPEGWQLWLDDSIPETDFSGVAPTQAISTGAPVSDPPSVGSAPAFEASAPSVGSAPAFGASAPSVASAPVFNTTPLGHPAPVVGSAPPSSSPYAANMDYAQSPTPYHSMPGQPQAAGWQPVDVNGGGQAAATPITKQWWFWAIIVGIVAVLVLVTALVFTLGGDKDKSATVADPATSAPSNPDPTEDVSPAPQPSGNAPAAGAQPSQAATSEQSTAPKSNGDLGKTRENPIDPETNGLTFHAGKYSDDPDAYIEIQFGTVTWDATEAIKTSQGKYGYEDPGAGNQYIRVPVTVTYHGKGQFEKYQLTVDYVDDKASSYKAKSIHNLNGAQDDFRYMDMPRDGGTVTGYFSFIIPSDQVNKGVFAVKAFYDKDELYVKAK